MPEIQPIIQRLASPVEQWEPVLDDILAAFDCPTGTLHQLDDTTEQLHLLAQRGIPEKLMPIVGLIPVGKGMAGICAKRKEPVQTCNLQTDNTGNIRPGAKETKMEGAMTVPILDGERLLGTLGVAKPVAYDFSDAETLALTDIAKAIGLSWIEGTANP
tara:strand:- start:4887 stop:5363 length:477 start_codon:yes stop_codon:yes gene_type:complete